MIRPQEDSRQFAERYLPGCCTMLAEGSSVRTPTAVILQPVVCEMEEAGKQDCCTGIRARHKPCRQLKSVGIHWEHFHCLHYVLPHTEITKQSR